LLLQEAAAVALEQMDLILTVAVVAVRVVIEHLLEHQVVIQVQNHQLLLLYQPITQ
jgi:hypothetical protein